MEKQKEHPEMVYNSIPKQVSRKDFNRYILPHLKTRNKGPKPKLSFYKIFNYILYVLHTGIQWKQLRTRRNELHWSNVYKWHNRWSKDGSYQSLFEGSVIHLKETDQLDTTVLHGDGSNTVAKKGGSGIGYSGHKHLCGDKEITVVDNNGFVIAPLEVRAVNVTDMEILPDSIASMVKLTHQIGIDINQSRLTLDSGFDSKTNKDVIKENQMKPVIYPNRRNTKKPIAIARLFRWFDRATYQLRYIVERTFAWGDVYRKLAVSYDRLEAIRLGCRHLAYSMINFRVTFNEC